MKTAKEQVLDLVNGSKHILITTRHQADYDEVATALAWLAWLKMKGKEVNIVLDNDNLGRFDWLPESHHLTLCEHLPRKFTIKVKTDSFKLRELSYELKDDCIEIYLSPKEGRIGSPDISHQENSWSYDLIITLGSPDKNSLGKVFEEFREDIQKTPIINIDRRSDNSNFGQLNIIDLLATSLAEISYEFMKEDLDKTLAHYLLTGMISATQSFQTPRVTPKTLTIASELIVAGAPREEIVLCLYRNKDIDTLRTWGIMLSRLEQKQQLVYSYVTKTELNGKGVDWKALANELILASPTAVVACLFYEQSPEQTSVRVYAKENYDLLAMLEKLNPQGNRRYVEISLAKSRQQAIEEVVALLTEKLKLTVS